MIGLLVLLCVLIVLGFILSWIAGVVAGVDISIGSSVMALLANGIAMWALDRYVLPGGTLGVLLHLLLSIVILGALVFSLATIKFKEGVLIAVIFSVLMWLISMLLALIAAA